VLSSGLSMSFDIPGTSSDIADSAIIAKYGSGGSEVPLVPVIKLPPGMTASQPAVRADLLSGCSAVSRISAGKYVFTAGGGSPPPAAKTSSPAGFPSRVVSYANTGNQGFVSADGWTTFGLVFTPTNGNQAHNPVIPLPAIRSTLSHYLPAGSQVQVTGLSPLTTQGASRNGPVSSTRSCWARSGRWPCSPSSLPP
jgi:putative drug exporter of the RND superfamily